ncbi:hypothetical protein Saga11_35070 [Bacillus safensis]|nr:hypothetical protein Saga11_35070 [Bacillus safensis]
MSHPPIFEEKWDFVAGSCRFFTKETDKNMIIGPSVVIRD